MRIEILYRTIKERSFFFFRFFPSPPCVFNFDHWNIEIHNLHTLHGFGSILSYILLLTLFFHSFLPMRDRKINIYNRIEPEVCILCILCKSRIGYGEVCI